MATAASTAQTAARIPVRICMISLPARSDARWCATVTQLKMAAKLLTLIEVSETGKDKSMIPEIEQVGVTHRSWAVGKKNLTLLVGLIAVVALIVFAITATVS